MSHYAYVTVLADDSDLPGIVVLAYSLRKAGSHLPLIVLCSLQVSHHVVDALKNQHTQANQTTHQLEFKVVQVNHGDLDPTTTIPCQSTEPVTETTTSDIFQLFPSLLVFSPELWEYETVCYLAPTTVVARRGMDLVFTEAQLPTDDCIAAVPLCTCANLGGSMGITACPYATQKDPGTPLRRAMSFSASVAAASPVEPGAMAPKNSKFNDGVMVFYPGERLWDKVRQNAFDIINKSKGDEVDDPRDLATIDQILDIQPADKSQDDTNNDMESIQLLERVFRDKWAALPHKYCVAEHMGLSHSGVASGHEKNVVCYQVQKSSWSVSNDEVSTLKSDEKVVSGELPKPDGQLSEPIPTTALDSDIKQDAPSTTDSSNGNKSDCNLVDETPLRLVTTFPQGQSRAWQMWMRAYDGWTNSAQNTDEQTLKKLVQNFTSTKVKNRTNSPILETPSNPQDGGEPTTVAKKALNKFLSPINEASPASEGHHSLAYLSMYRPSQAAERGHGPVLHHHALPVTNNASSSRQAPDEGR
jgi:hypothetical protein